MKLYHYTRPENVRGILKGGLTPNRIGVVYLTPAPGSWKPDNEVCLEVETGDLKLTAFEDCCGWEVLCWGHIPPRNIKFAHIGKDTVYHCRNCGHHHCLICNLFHRCGCQDYAPNTGERRRRKAELNL